MSEGIKLEIEARVGNQDLSWILEISDFSRINAMRVGNGGKKSDFLGARPLIHPSWNTGRGGVRCELEMGARLKSDFFRRVNRVGNED